MPWRQTRGVMAPAEQRFLLNPAPFGATPLTDRPHGLVPYDRDSLLLPFVKPDAKGKIGDNVSQMRPRPRCTLGFGRHSATCRCSMFHNYRQSCGQLRPFPPENRNFRLISADIVAPLATTLDLNHVARMSPHLEHLRQAFVATFAPILGKLPDLCPLTFLIGYYWPNHPKDPWQKYATFLPQLPGRPAPLIFENWCPRSDSNRHASRRRILSPLRLPFHHSGHLAAS